jgi:hypothetical protein
MIPPSRRIIFRLPRSNLLRMPWASLGRSNAA